jgi:hypothetical protein
MGMLGFWEACGKGELGLRDVVGGWYDENFLVGFSF